MSREKITPSQARRVLQKRRAHLVSKVEKLMERYGENNYASEEVAVIDWLLLKLDERGAERTK